MKRGYAVHCPWIILVQSYTAFLMAGLLRVVTVNCQLQNEIIFCLRDFPNLFEQRNLMCGRWVVGEYGEHECLCVCVCVHEVWGMCGGSGCVYVCLHVSVGVVGVSVSVGDATHHVGVCSISQVSCWDMLQ